MKSFGAIITTALVATGVSAQQAVVHNNCDADVYVQSFPYDGSAAGTLTTVKKGEAFSENFRASGSTVKIGNDKTFSAPLFFGYSFSANPDYAYYELSTEWGNPFADKRNILTPGSGCEQFNCAAGDVGCYSRPGAKKVYGCPQPVNLEATLCA